MRDWDVGYTARTSCDTRNVVVRVCNVLCSVGIVLALHVVIAPWLSYHLDSVTAQSKTAKARSYCYH